MRPPRMPSPGTIIALFALFVALGGTGYAASEIMRSTGSPNEATTAAKKQALTKKTVNRLIERYFKQNRKKLVGSQGPAGRAGTPGSEGLQGPKGNPGSPGAAGAAVALRARGNSTVMTQDGTGFTDYPMTNNAWTQSANETDLFVGEVTFTSTPTIGGCGTTVGIDLQLFVDSTLVRTYRFIADGSWTASSVHTLVLPIDTYVFEPGSDTPHTLTAKVGDHCPNAGSIATVSKLSVDVVRFR